LRIWALLRNIMCLKHGSYGITISKDLLKKAREKEINISSFVDIELRRYLALIEGKGSNDSNSNMADNNSNDSEWARRDLNSSYQHPKLEGCQATPRAQK